MQCPNSKSRGPASSLVGRGYERPRLFLLSYLQITGKTFSRKTELPRSETIGGLYIATKKWEAPQREKPPAVVVRPLWVILGCWLLHPRLGSAAHRHGGRSTQDAPRHPRPAYH